LFDQGLPENSGEDSHSFSDVLIAKGVQQPRTDIAVFVKKVISFIDGDWKLVG